MCLICVEFEKNRLTISEARRNLKEMVSTISSQHALEVRTMLQEAKSAQVYQQIEDDLKDPNYWEALYELADVYNWND